MSNLFDFQRRELMAMRQFTLVAAAVTLVLGGAGQARADLFNFTFNDPIDGITASGTLVATDDGGGQFTATSVINGMITGNPGGDGALTLITNPNAPSGYTSFGDFTYDDSLYQGGPVPLPIDDAGLLFSVPDGSVLNIYLESVSIAPFFELDDGDSAGNFTFASADVTGFTLTPLATPVPEPSALCLLGIGAAGLVARRKQKRS
jgi:hypothetical protein